MKILESKRKRPHQHHFRKVGIYVFESRHSEDFTMDMGQWDFHKLCVILKGRGFLETEKAMTPISENHLLYLPPLSAHRFLDQREDPLTLVMVCFYDHAFSGNQSSLEVLSLFREKFPAMIPFNLSDNYGRLKVKNSFKVMLIEQVQRREGSTAALWCHLVELLVFLIRLDKEQRKVAGEDRRAMAFAGSIDFINNNFYRQITVKELATLANLSYRSYTEHFKRSTGKTVTQYLSESSVAYAKRLMLESEDVLFAAFESGFGDVAHLYRVFKKKTGHTKKQFIASQKTQSQRTELLES